MEAVLCSKKRTDDYLWVINEVYNIEAFISPLILIALRLFWAHSEQYKEGFSDA